MLEGIAANPDKKIVLKPNEKLLVSNNDFSLVPQESAAKKKDEEGPMMILSKVHYFEKNDSVATETLWVKNKLVFDTESLENVALKIERWFDVKVIITDEKLKKEPYHAIFDDESLQEVIDALSTNSFKYTINKKEVIIKPK